MTVEELNQKAPITTAWAKGMREIFGYVQLLRLKEGDVQIGRPDPHEWAPVIHKGNGKRFDEPDEQRTHKR